MVLSALAILLACYVYAGQKPTPQNTPPKTPPKAPMDGQRPDQFEDAHRGIFAPKPTGEEVGRQTNELARSLPGSGAPMARMPRKNFIDEAIFGRIERDKIPHAGLSNDQEFVRRVYLDVTGMLPTTKQVLDFVADKDANKRDKLIDSLIGAEEFAEQWAWYWGDLLRLGSDTGYGKNAFQHWLKEWLTLDRPYNDVVTDMLTPAAKNHSAIPSLGLMGQNNVGQNNLPKDADDFRVTNRLDVADEFSIDTARIFLGINSTCISCHDGAGHLEEVNTYLANKTREEFYRNSAFFGKLRTFTYWSDRSKNTGNDDQVVDDLGQGYNTGHDAPFITESILHYPRDGKTHEPAFLLTGEKPRPGVNLRVEYARMLTNHIQFARATVNLVWSRLMTVGFVTPYDGFDFARLDPKNPPKKPWSLQPTNAELLEAMAQEFKKSNYSIQHVIRSIMKSNAYQLSAKFPAEWKDGYTPYYARKYIRMMTGPEVIDALTQVTNRPAQFNLSGVPMTRVKQLTFLSDVGGRGRGGNVGEGAEISGLMQAFFQGNRNTQVPDGNRPSTLQALMMTSLSVVNNRVLAENGSRVQQLLESKMSNESMIDEMFLTALARRPTPEEREVALQALEKDRKRGAENIQWALLNNMEFVLNH